MIDLKKETLERLAKACRRLPNPPSPVTLWRWRTKGVNNVRLECIRCGKYWYTTREAIERFLAAQTTITAEKVSAKALPVKQRLADAGLL
jgi:hypothetical protein